jgi:hypothetical protein
MVSLDHIRTLYQASLAAHGDSPAAVQWPKGRQDLRFAALTRHISADSSGSLLDFGCGLGHMRLFLRQHFPAIKYNGVDIVPEFIQTAKQTHTDASFQLIQAAEDIAGSYDYITASGVFNIAFDEDKAANMVYIFNTLQTLFGKCLRYLSINFMTDKVDYEQPGAYHQNIPTLYDFCHQHLSPRLVIDQSDMPYEFTITIFKDATILRPDNIYAPR